MQQFKGYIAGLPGAASGPTTRASPAADIPGRRGHHLGLGRRPAHLPGERPDPGPPGREGARHPARPGRQLIDDNTDGRALGVLGEPGVNVLELNIALDKESPQ